MADAVGDRLGQVVSERDPGSPHVGRDDPHTAISDHLAEGTPFHQVEENKNYIAVCSENGYIIYQRQFLPDTESP